MIRALQKEILSGISLFLPASQWKCLSFRKLPGFNLIILHQTDGIEPDDDDDEKENRKSAFNTREGKKCRKTRLLSPWNNRT